MVHHAIAALLTAALAAPAQDSGPAPPAPRRVGEHAAAITHLALSSDGKVLFSAASDLEIHAWDLKKSRLLWKSSVASITWQIAGLGAGKDSVAWTGGMAHATFLDQATGERLERKGGSSPSQDAPACLLADRDDRWVWIGTGGQLQRVTPGNPSTGWGFRAVSNGGTLCLAVDASGQSLAIGGRDGTIQFMNPTASTLEEERFEGHPGPVTVLAFDPKGKALVSGCADGRLRRWDLKEGEPTELPSPHASAVVGLSFDPKGKRLVTADDRGSLTVRDAKSGEKQLELAVAPAARLDLVFVDDDLLAVPDGERVALWELGKP